MSGGNRDTSPWLSRSPSIGASSLENGNAGQPSSEHAPTPDTSDKQRDQPAADSHASIVAPTETTPVTDNDIQLLQAASTSMHPPPLPIHRATSSVHDDSQNLRDESPMFCSDSRQSTREPSAEPSAEPQIHPPPPQHRVVRSLRSESPLFVQSRQHTLEPQAQTQETPISQPALPPIASYTQQPPSGVTRSLRSESPIFVPSRQQTLEPQVQVPTPTQTQISTRPLQQPTLPPATPHQLEQPLSFGQRGLRSDSPVIAGSREQALEPHAQPQTGILPRATQSSTAGRNNAQTPTPDPQDEDSLFVPSRDATMTPPPQSAPPPQPEPQPEPEPQLESEPQSESEPQPEAQAQTVLEPIVETTPTPGHIVTPQADQSAAHLGPVANHVSRSRSTTEERILGVIDQLIRNETPNDSTAAQQPIADLPQPTRGVVSATTESKSNKRKNTADDQLDNPSASNSLGSSPSHHAAKKQKITGKQTRKRKRGPETEATPIPQSEGRGGGDDDDKSSNNGIAGGGSLDLFQGCWRTAQKSSLKLRNNNPGGDGGQGPGKRSRGGQASGSSSGAGHGRTGFWKSHSISVSVEKNENLEMPTRNDFIYGYSRLRAKHFKWGPKEEAASTGGHAPIIASPPCIGDPTKDDKDCPKPPRAKRRCQPTGRSGGSGVSAFKHDTMARGTSSVAHRETPNSPDPPASTTGNSSSLSEPEIFLHERPPNLLFFPPEIRERIWRHLLVADKAILVDRKWTRVCRVMRPRNGDGDGDDSTLLNLDPTILRTCRLFFQETSGILYGENTFRYRMRDSLSVSMADDDGGKAGGDDDDDDDDGVRQDEDSDDEYVDEARRPEDDDDEYVEENGHGSPLNDDDDGRDKRRINIERYYHLFRHIAVGIEQNRTSRQVMASVAQAIKVFSDRNESSCSPAVKSLERQPNIHTLKLIIHPTIKDNEVVSFTFTNFFVDSSPVVQAMRALQAQFLYIDVMSVFLNRNEKNVRLVVDLRPCRVWNLIQAGGILGRAKKPDRAMVRGLDECRKTCHRVMRRLDKHVKSACEQYAVNGKPFHSPYCWFVSDLQEDEYNYMF